MHEGAGTSALTEGAVHRILDALPEEVSFLDRVRRTILEELGLGEPKLARLAQRMQLSERTLQRWLQRERTSVQALIDGARRELALRQLASTSQSIAQIAHQVGFAEVRAFHRAFKRWTGSTPAAYRRSVLVPR
ncbi:MAG TPA: helix-turn-helix transcriptional regulator [Kofleriaceae bacterium]|nr:helix-turn-helix transcriptional regulator [Kofleriaceae bacterium]